MRQGLSPLEAVLSPERVPVGLLQPDRDSRPAAAGVPILMYHKVGLAPAGSRIKSLWVHPRRFRWQMEWLRLHGFTPMTLAQIDLATDGGFHAEKVSAKKHFRARPPAGSIRHSARRHPAVVRCSRGRRGERGPQNLEQAP